MKYLKKERRDPGMSEIFEKVNEFIRLNGNKNNPLEFEGNRIFLSNSILGKNSDFCGIFALFYLVSKTNNKSEFSSGVVLQICGYSNTFQPCAIIMHVKDGNKFLRLLHGELE